MNKLAKKAIGLTVASMMLATVFTGCSDKKPVNDTKAPSETTAPKTDKKDEVTEEGPLFKETLKFSYMGNIWDPHPQDGNPIFDELMKRTNTEIDFQWHPASNYGERVAVTLASGTLPDMIYGGSIPNLIDQGAIIPIDDLLEEHGQNLLAHLREGDMPYMRQALDGQIYHLPAILDFQPAYAMQIREDWLKNVGIEKTPETWDEWKTAWKAFKDQDANKDGDATNEVPYAGDIYSLLPAFGINIADRIGFVQDADGNYTLMYELPEFREYLEEMRSLYKEGILDKEFATRGTFVNNPELEKVAQANLAGSMMTWAANTRTTTEVLREIDPDAKLIGVKPIQGPSGKSGIPARKTVSGSATITIAGEKKAEDIIKFFNYVYSEEGINLMSYGIEGVHNEIVDGKPVLKAPYNESFAIARETGLNFTPFPHLFTEDAYMQLTLTGKTYDEISEPMQMFYDALYVGQDAFFTSLPILNTDAYTEKQAQIFPNLEGLLAQCVAGDISVDQFYSEYEKLKPVGLKDILAQGNEAWKLVSQK
ncbi:MAG: extracellular solute-binding protein [Epulopiscium sp.]|mgnify:CR=1 FL=1|nr:extracellular solute-binding protein [Candidatus Epulonipiscium sp.]